MDESWWKAVGHLRHSVLTAQPGFNYMTGQNFFDCLTQRPEAEAWFDRGLANHDWSDEECLQILGTCRAAMSDQARLLVVEAVVPPGNDFHPSKDMDTLMMVFAAGREHTPAEFHELFQQSGFKLAQVVPTPSVLLLRAIAHFNNPPTRESYFDLYAPQAVFTSFTRTAVRPGKYQIVLSRLLACFAGCSANN